VSYRNMRLPSGEKKSRGGAFELTRDRASFQASQALSFFQFADLQLFVGSLSILSNMRYLL